MATKFQNNILVETCLGDHTTQPFTNLDTADANWGTDTHRVLGTAAVAIRYRWNQDVFSGIPKFTAIIEGSKVLDIDVLPTQTRAYSTNPAHILFDYLTNPIYGKGLSVTDGVDIDLQSFKDAATYCDTLVDSYTGGPTHARFTANLVVPSGRQIMDNITLILQSFGGTLPYIDGKFYLIVEKHYTPADYSLASYFNFNTDNIIGNWNFKYGDISSRFNRVKVTFADEDWMYRNNSVIVDSTAYRTQDGRLLEKNVTLPSVTNIYRAIDMGNIVIKKSRFQTLVSFTATPEAMQVRAGTIVTVTHETPGWTDKQFRVTKMNLMPSGNVSVTLSEHNSTVYDTSVGPEYVAPPDTTLPDPTIVPDVTGLTLTSDETVLLTGDDGTLVPQLKAAWTRPSDVYISGYEIQYKRSVDSVWLPAGSTNLPASTEIFIQNVDQGTEYDVRVRAVNSELYFGDWTTVTNHTIVGKTSNPGAPTSLTATTNLNGVVLLTWTNPTDLDLASITIYRSATDWAAATELAQISAPGEEHIDPVPDGGTYKYWVRAFDTSEFFSAVEPNDTVGITGTALNATTESLAGSGVNILNYKYSVFEEDRPTDMVVEVGSYSFDTAQQFFGNYSLKLSATGANCEVSLSNSSTGYNFPISPNRKWILSAYVRSSAASTSIQMFIRASDASFFTLNLTTSGTAGTWDRVSGVLDMSANSSTYALVRLANEGGAGVDVWWDGIMLEEQIGSLTTPSAYALPSNSSIPPVWPNTDNLYGRWAFGIDLSVDGTGTFKELTGRLSNNTTLGYAANSVSVVSANIENGVRFDTAGIALAESVDHDWTTYGQQAWVIVFRMPTTAPAVSSRMISRDLSESWGISTGEAAYTDGLMNAACQGGGTITDGLRQSEWHVGIITFDDSANALDYYIFYEDGSYKMASGVTSSFVEPVTARHVALGANSEANWTTGSLNTNVFTGGIVSEARYYREYLSYEQCQNLANSLFASGAGSDLGIDQLSGSGVNIANYKYSVWEEVRPDLADNANGSYLYDSDAGDQYIGTYGLRMAATAADYFLTLGASVTDSNIPIEPNQKWIVSCYAKGSAAGLSGQMYVRSSAGTYYGFAFTTSTTIGDWTRHSFVADLTEDSSTECNIRLDNDGGNGAVIHFDGIMMEKQVGTGTTPSAYALPTGQVDSHLQIKWAYQVAASQPTTPGVGTGTYNFETKAFTPPSGWSETPPATDGNLWITFSEFTLNGPAGVDDGTNTWVVPFSTQENNSTVGATIGTDLDGSFTQTSWDTVMDSALINAAHIDSLSADDITAGTLTARTVQTASTGQRMVLNATTNEAEFYDASNKLLTIGINTADSGDNTVVLMGSVASPISRTAIDVNVTGVGSGIASRNHTSTAISGFASGSTFGHGVSGQSNASQGKGVLAKHGNNGVPFTIDNALSSNTAPTAGLQTGDFWIPFDNSDLYFRIGGAWETIMHSGNFQGWELLETWTPTAVSSKDFTWTTGLYSEIVVNWDSVRSSSVAILRMRIGNDAGTFYTANDEYSWAKQTLGLTSLTGWAHGGTGATAGYVELTGSVGDDTAEGTSGVLHLSGGFDTSSAPLVWWAKSAYLGDSANTFAAQETVALLRNAAADDDLFNRVRLYWTNGNYVASRGEVRIYGRKK
ncbi:MAG: fibronectin type III domain-containing protein [Reinekea sp.]|nr:fibronectin type III domain-containing protein [Reinekea sp.]